MEDSDNEIPGWAWGDHRGSLLDTHLMRSTRSESVSLAPSQPLKTGVVGAVVVADVAALMWSPPPPLHQALLCQQALSQWPAHTRGGTDHGHTCSSRYMCLYVRDRDAG